MGDLMDDDARRLGEEAMRRLRAAEVCYIGPGLTDAEFARIEAEHGFQFADDHRAFLAAGLPVNAGPPAPEPGVFYTHAEPWPDWRHGDPAALRETLGWPVEGVLFDVEHNVFWDPTWGPRPADLPSALDTARRRLAEVPQMVPVHAHRYLPPGRGTFGHPVLSMWQTDIIYYGVDLADYIDQEFAQPRPPRDAPAWNPRATVDFWRDFL